MSRIAYVNGHYLPHYQANIHIDDRGYQFGDGIYEVVTVIKGKMVDQDEHLDRMEYSLSEMGIPMPMTRRALLIIIAHMIRVNKISFGLVYFQITRGVMRRDHASNVALVPQVVMTAKHLQQVRHEAIEPVAVITVPDQRWQRRDIKTLQLLPNCMAKTKASAVGAYEAWMVDADGFVTEGSSSNAWIVTKQGELITRPTSYDILSGVTRKAVVVMAGQRNLKIVERGFTPEEALNAEEAFMTSASSLVTPVGRLDDILIGDGQCGPVAATLRKSYFDFVDQKGKKSS
jgi:D-alanine transaminase